MGSLIYYKLLLATMNKSDYADISVCGNSMQPTLNDKDIITIRRQNNYNIGDIVVFWYKDSELLVHRILKIDKNYYCKGDNSFRLENINPELILGKVVKVNKKDILPWFDWQIDFSYTINRIFHQHKYNIKLTKQTDEYKLYEAIILHKDEFLRQINNYFDYEINPNPISFSLITSYNTNLPLSKDETEIIVNLTNSCTIAHFIRQLNISENHQQATYDKIGNLLFNLVQKGIIRVLL